MTAEQQWLEALKSWKRGEPLPPCPICGGKMESWDAWLITGETCESCKWSSCEGTECLI